MGSSGGAKTIASLDHHDTSSSSLDQTTLIDLNELSSGDLSHPTATTTTTTVPIISALNTSNATPSPNNSLIILTTPAGASTSVASPLAKQKQTNNNNTKQEWQFLQTALNDDFYTTNQDQTNNSTVIKLNNLTPITLTTNATATATPQQIVTVSDLNIETILQMQCDLLEQQKELKTIELETMEQLRLLQQNISKLARKFDSFETSCGKYFSLPCNNGDLAKAKNVLNKFNSSLELIKDLQQANAAVTPLGPSTSTLSSSSSPTTTTTTVTLTNDLETHAKSTTTIVNLLPSSSSTPTTTNNNSTKEEESSNNENLDQSAGSNTAPAGASTAGTANTNIKTTTRSQGMRNKRFKLV